MVVIASTCPPDKLTQAIAEAGHKDYYPQLIGAVRKLAREHQENFEHNNSKKTDISSRIDGTCAAFAFILARDAAFKHDEFVFCSVVQQCHEYGLLCIVTYCMFHTMLEQDFELVVSKIPSAYVGLELEYANDAPVRYVLRGSLLPSDSAHESEPLPPVPVPEPANPAPVSHDDAGDDDSLRESGAPRVDVDTAPAPPKSAAACSVATVPRIFYNKLRQGDYQVAISTVMLDDEFESFSQYLLKAVADYTDSPHNQSPTCYAQYAAGKLYTALLDVERQKRAGELDGMHSQIEACLKIDDILISFAITI